MVFDFVIGESGASRRGVGTLVRRAASSSGVCADPSGNRAVAYRKIRGAMYAESDPVRKLH